MVVEHKTDLLLATADRIVLLAAGRVVAEGAAKAVLAGPELETSGVEPPARFRLARALEAGGLSAELIDA